VAVGMLFMVIGTTCVSKIITGTMIVATTWGHACYKTFVIDFLTNTKGHMEFIVLNIGFAKGVCNPFLFVNL
jgi:Kef-type K+ transport system membrane component KefB